MNFAFNQHNSASLGLTPVKDLFKFASTPFDYSPGLVNVATDQANCMTDYVADCVMPFVDSPTCTFMYQDWDKVQPFTPVDDAVGPTSRVHEVQLRKTTLLTDEVEGHGLDAVITWCMNQAMGTQCSNVPANYRDKIAAYITSLIKLNREHRVASLVNDPAFYATSNKLDLSVGNAQFNFNGASASDPLTVLSDIINNTQSSYNWMVTSKKVMAYLRRHPSFLGNVDNRGIVSNETIAGTLGLDGICEGRSYENITGTNAPVWDQVASGAVGSGNYILLFLKNENVFSTDCPIPTFAFTARVGGWFAANLQSPFHGLRGVEFMRVGEEVKEKVLSYNFAFLLYNVLV